jgi:hypothetical protein
VTDSDPGVAATAGEAAVGVREFVAVIEAGTRGGAGVTLPFDIEEAWGARRVPIRATFDGIEYRGSAVYMGGRPLLGVTRAVRDAIGKEIGDSVRVAIARDLEPRTVDLPEELATALALHPAQQESFDALAYTHRKEYARWIADAKRAETRHRRVATALRMLADGERLS